MTILSVTWLIDPSLGSLNTSLFLQETKEQQRHYIHGLLQKDFVREHEFIITQASTLPRLFIVDVRTDRRFPQKALCWQ